VIVIVYACAVTWFGAEGGFSGIPRLGFIVAVAWLVDEVDDEVDGRQGFTVSGQVLFQLGDCSLEECVVDIPVPAADDRGAEGVYVVYGLSTDMQLVSGCRVVGLQASIHPASRGVPCNIMEPLVGSTGNETPWRW
jgi:hypothetical protein